MVAVLCTHLDTHMHKQNNLNNLKKSEYIMEKWIWKFEGESKHLDSGLIFCYYIKIEMRHSVSLPSPLNVVLNSYQKSLFFLHKVGTFTQSYCYLNCRD